MRYHFENVPGARGVNSENLAALGIVRNQRGVLRVNGTNSHQKFGCFTVSIGCWMLMFMVGIGWLIVVNIGWDSPGRSQLKEKKLQVQPKHVLRGTLTLCYSLLNRAPEAALQRTQCRDGADERGHGSPRLRRAAEGDSGC